MKVILSYGMGVESTAILLRWMLEPASRWFAWSDLIIVVAQTGDEFPDTRTLVETHIFPLLRTQGVRFVQLARLGPTEADGWVVLDDTVHPRELYIRHPYWKLSDEMRRAGTLPQCQSRRCSIKFKGWVIDNFVAQALGGYVRRETVEDEDGKKKTLNIIEVPEPFFHVVGFNADEQERIKRDTTCGGRMRTARYPLMEWGWNRQACQDYIRAHLGVEWRKSCCVMCPFADGNAEILARYHEFPEVAADALLLEHVALSLNPKTTLYRDRTLRSVIEQDGNEQALELFHAQLSSCQWSLYRVRRVMTRKGGGDRSVEKVEVGSQLAVYQALAGLGGTVEADGGILRVYLARREPGVYPAFEEFYVGAPALADDKQKPSFEATWGRIALQTV